MTASSSRNRNLAYALVTGGLVLLVARHVLGMSDVAARIDQMTMVAGSIAGYACLWLGFWLGTRRSAAPAEELRSRSAPAGPPAEAVRPAEAPPHPVHAMLSTYLASADRGECESWVAFDQLVRELLGEHVQAARVRCFRVLADDDRLRPLAQGPDAAGCATKRDGGILGHVANTGREYSAANAAAGETVHDLARASDEPWEWIWPIRCRGMVVGLVAVGRVGLSAARDESYRRQIGAALTLLWTHMDAQMRLHLLTVTDRASGLLTREEFFAAASEAVEESYRANEPVVVAALVIEGLRRMDDQGRWQQRDQVIAAVAHVLAQRARSGDVVGRFTDDRFTFLFRRLDAALGALVTQKIVEAIERRLGETCDESESVAVRAGVAGSGARREPLAELLVAAVDAAELARQRSQRVVKAELHEAVGARR